MDEGDERTKAWCQRYERLRSDRTVWETAWQDCADYLAPRMAGIQRKYYTPTNNTETYLFDTEGGHAIQTAASGFMSWTTPKSSPWMKYAPSLQQRSFEPVRRWLHECSMLAAEYLANSNFYTNRHEYLLGLFTFGTACLYSDINDDGTAHFEHVPIGTYVIDEDKNGLVDTLMRKLKPMTARIARDKFGEENLPKCVRECLDKPEHSDKTFDFLHIVEPRPASERGETGRVVGKRKAFVSAYVELSSKKLVFESGFDTFPFHVGRFLEWTAMEGRQVWGYGPGFTILPEARQANFLQKMMDVHAEKTVFPPLMAPESMRGAVKTAARAMNYYDNVANGADSIKPLFVTGDWQIAFERLKERHEVMRRKCHLDMFQMFSGIDREMTAFEASQRAGEKIDAISPAFDRDTGECITPMAMRMFGLWAEAGMLPPPPQEALIVRGNTISVGKPSVEMTSRLAMQIRALSMRDADRVAQTVLAMAPIVPDVTDAFNWDAYVVLQVENSTAPTQLLRTSEERDAIRAQRQQAMMAQQAAMMAKEASTAVKNVGGLDKARELMGA